MLSSKYDLILVKRNFLNAHEGQDMHINIFFRRTCS